MFKKKLNGPFNFKNESSAAIIKTNAKKTNEMAMQFFTIVKNYTRLELKAVMTRQIMTQHAVRKKNFNFYLLDFP